jgi:hypothetical protein
LWGVFRLEIFSVYKKSSLKGLCSIEPLTIPILLIKLPLSPVEAAVIPVHHPVSAAHIVLVIALVEVTARPSVNPITILPVIPELALVLIIHAASALPHPMSVAQTVAEPPLVVLAVLPEELSEAVEPAFTVLALVKVAVLEVLHALTVFHEV